MIQKTNLYILLEEKQIKQKPFAITNPKLYVPVVTLSIQDKVELLQQPKSGFKFTIIWNKYQSKISTQAQKQYLDYLIDYLRSNFTFCVII